jgi:hypothetical protein
MHKNSELDQCYCFESLNKITQCCVEYQQAAVLFDKFEAVTKNILLYTFGWSYNSLIARNSVTMLTLLTVKNVLAE